MKPGWRRALLIFAALTLLAVAVGITLLVTGWTKHNERVVLPQPAGPYGVGRADYDWVDESRPEVFTADPNDHRELPVSIWYPISAGAPAGPKLPYYAAGWRAAEQREHGGLLAAFVTQNLADVEAHSVQGGSVAGAGAAFPVVVFQPGLGPSHPDYTTLAEDLASRGYIVAATTPTYSANVVVFPDGRVAQRVAAATVPDSASAAESKAKLDKLIEIWAADNVFVMNKLRALNAGDPEARFEGKLDLESIGLMGHSFGGASAAETCYLDARCKAGVDLDGSPYGEVIDQGLKQPFLFMWSVPGFVQQEAQGQSMQDVQALVSRSPGPVFELTVDGARHFNFSDYAALYEPLLKPMQMLGSIDGRRGLQLTATYVAAFFDQYLKQEPQILLQGPAPDYPEVQFEVHHGG